MKEKINRLFVISFCVFFFSLCATSKEHQELEYQQSDNNTPTIVLETEAINEGFLVHGLRNVNVLGQLDTAINWTQYKSTNDAFHFCVPSTWTLRPYEDAEFLFVLDTNKSSSYFALTTNPKASEDTTPSEYVKYMLNEIKLDRGRNLEIRGIEAYENSFREVYYLDFEEEDGTNYLVVVTESDKYILDFTMQFSGKNIDFARMMFQWTMSSFLINGNSVMGLKAKLESIQVGMTY